MRSQDYLFARDLTDLSIGGRNRIGFVCMCTLPICRPLWLWLWEALLVPWCGLFPFPIGSCAVPSRAEWDRGLYTAMGFHAISLPFAKNVAVGSTSMNSFWSQSQRIRPLDLKYCCWASRSLWMLLVAYTTIATCLLFSRSTRTLFPTVGGFRGSS